MDIDDQDRERWSSPGLALDLILCKSHVRRGLLKLLELVSVTVPFARRISGFQR